MSSKELITQLYVGYFDRAPDPAGLAFWIAVLDGGLSLEAIAIDFSTQPEAQDTYAYLDALIPPGPVSGGDDIEAFITAIYDNLFDRSPDAAGLAFWTAVLEGGFPPGSFILAIIEGASPADAVILQNKVDVACAWVDNASAEPGFVLTQDYIDASRDTLGDVSDDPASVDAGKDAADLFFQDAPTVALSGATTTLPEDTDLTARLKVADIVVTDDGIGTNDLSLSGTDAALFEIDGTELFLKAGTVLDFETATALDVTVEVDDAGVGGTPDDTAALSIAITDANDAPEVALTGQITVLEEDADTSAATKVANIVITDDALGTNDLSLSGDDAALFEIVGSELFLKAGTALDFDTNPSLDVTVEVDDAGVGSTPDDSANQSITVVDVNEAPSVALSNEVAILAEDVDLTSRLKVADIIVTDDIPGSNVLSLSGDDAALFEIDRDELFLKAGSALDFETNSTLDVTVEVDDAGVGAAPDDTADLTITVTNVNEPPQVALNNTVTTLPEDTDTTSAIKMADIVVTDDGTGSNTLSLTGADAALFEIVGTELFLKAGSALDFESNPALDVTVEVDDGTVGTDPDDSAALSVAVTDVNEAPSVALTGALTAIAETEDTSSRIKVADIVISDDALGTNALSLTGADAALFEIDGSELFLKAGTVLDFEANAALDVTVEIEDGSVGGTPDDSAALTIAVTDTNEAPTVAVTGVPASLPEDTDITARLKVGDIVVTDDLAGVNMLSLTGSDAALFEIDGSELFLKAGTGLDFESNASLDVTVEVDDPTLGTGVDDSAPLTIPVTDVNEAPTVALTAPLASLAEDASTVSRVKVADIVVTDDALGTNLLSLTGSDAALFEIDGSELFLKAGTVLDFETNPSLDVTVEVDDAGVGATPDDSAALAVTVTNVNEAPTVTLAAGGSAIFEGTDTTGPVSIASIQVNDDGTGTNVLGLTGADAALFEIVGNVLRLKAGTALDAVANPSLDVTVTVDDVAVGGTPDDSDSLSIGVLPGVPGLASDTTPTIVISGNASSVLRVGQIEVADADPNTPGNQPGFVFNTDPNGTPYAGVAGDVLTLIDVTGLDGLASFGVIARADPDDFTIDNSGSPGDVEACLGEGNVFGALVTPTVSSTGTWTFDNSGATGTMEIQIKAINVAAGGTLDFDNVDICITGDVDLTGVVLDVDAASTIEVKAGGKLTLTVEQVDDLEFAGVVIFGEGTVCVTGESDSSDTDFDTTFGAVIQTATMDLSAVTLDAGDMTLEIDVPGAMSDDASTPLVDTNGDRVAQTVIGSANNDEATILASAGDGDNQTLDVITRLGADSGDIGVPAETPTTNTPADLTPEVVGDQIIHTGSGAQLRIEVDAGFDQTDFLTSETGNLPDAVQVASGAEFYAAGISNVWAADAESFNDGVAVVESDGSVDEEIDVSDAGGNWILIGAPDDSGSGDMTTIAGSDQDDTIIDGRAELTGVPATEGDNDMEEDTFSGNAGADTFIFNVARSQVAQFSNAVVQVGQDLEEITATTTYAPGTTIQLFFDIGATSPAVVQVTDGVGGVDLQTSVDTVATAIANALNARSDAFATTTAGGIIVAGALNAGQFALIGGANFAQFPTTNGLGDFGFYGDDPVDGDDDRSEAVLTISGTVAVGEVYTVTIARGDGTSYEGTHTVTAADLLAPVPTQAVLDNLALALIFNSGGSQFFYTANIGGAVPPAPDAPQSGAPGPLELLVLDFDMEVSGGFSISAAGGVSTVVSLSSSSVLAGTETLLSQADADVITDFVSADDSIDFLDLPAGTTPGAYAEGAAPVTDDFAGALADANTALGGGATYYMTSTTADGGLLFYDANGDGDADGVVSLPGVDATTFDASDII